MKHMLKSPAGAGLAVLLTAALSACGGSGGSSTSAPNTDDQVTVSGTVTDPAIRSARVRLEDADGNALAAITLSDSNGQFSFTGISTSRLNGAVVSATGGTDSSTGTDFTGLTLQAPYQAGTPLFITPLTTLLLQDVQNNGLSYSAAASNLATRLQLNSDTLAANPASDSTLQKASLQLSLLASALRAAGGFAPLQPLISAHGNDWSAINDDIQSGDFSATIQARMAALVSELDAIDAIDAIDSSLSSTATINEANRLSFVAGVSHFLSNTLGYNAGDVTGTTNIRLLAEALWQANGQAGIPSDSAQFANLIRYTFNTYSISTSDLDDSNWTPPAAIASDTRISSIATLQVIDHTIALTSEDLLQTADAKREYFYASDLSPYYRAQRIFDGVLDDTVTDPVYAGIAEAMASNNRIDELNVILNTQIANPADQANAAQNVADVFLKQGKTGLALQYLDQAWSIYKPVIEAIEIANITKDQANFLQQLAGSYNDAGETGKGSEVLAPLTSYIAGVNGTYSTTYAQIISAFNQQASALTTAAGDAGLSAASVASAQQTLTILAQLADGLGPNGTTVCYKAKGSYYVSLAEYYRQLQKPDQVRVFINKFVALRSSSDCPNTAVQTDVYVDDLVDAYLYLDDLAGYNALVSSMTSSTANADAALLLVQAFSTAKNGNTADAIVQVTDAYDSNTISGLTSQLQWLTNVGINRGSPYLSVLLFNAGYTTEGAQVLDKAWEIATSNLYNSSTNLTGITASWWGCPKVAQLTYDFVDQTLGKQRMQQCVSLADLYINSGNDKAAYYAYTHLINGLLLTGNSDLAVERFAYLNGIIENMADADYITAARYILNYALPSGIIEAGLDFADITALQNSQMSRLNNLISAANTETLRKAIATNAGKIGASYVETANGLQNRTIKTGLTDAGLADKIRTMRNAVAAVVNAAQPASAALTNSTNINNAFGTYAEMLSNARLYDDALALTRLDLFSGSDANDLRTIVAEAIMAEDDFTGSAILARDYDLDGLPDFFEASASAADISASGITLDTDSDNDGITDTADSTPFYCESCTD